MKKNLLKICCIFSLLFFSSCSLTNNKNDNTDIVVDDENENNDEQLQNGVLKYLGNKYEIYEINKEYEFQFEVSSFLKEKLVYEVGNKSILEFQSNGNLLTKSTGITYVKIYNSEYTDYEFLIPVYVFESINQGNLSDVLDAPLYSMFEVTGKLENVNNYSNKKTATLIDENYISYEILLSDDPKECITASKDAFNVNGHIRLTDYIESSNALINLKNGDVVKVLIMGEEASVFGKKDYTGSALLLDIISQDDDTDCVINNMTTHYEVSCNKAKYNELFTVKCLSADIDYIRVIGTHDGLLYVNCDKLDEEYSLLTYLCESSEITIFDTRYTLFDTKLTTFTTKTEVYGQENPEINKETIHDILFDNCTNLLFDANELKILNYKQISGLSNKGLNIGLSNSMTRSYISFSIPVNFKVHSISIKVVSMEAQSIKRSDVVINNTTLGSVYGTNIDADGDTFEYTSIIPISHISIASGSIDNDSYGFILSEIVLSTLHYTQFDS
ncbi:MAG: hypothetical protein ACI311_02150 [Bacilli bacterium]